MFGKLIINFIVFVVCAAALPLQGGYYVADSEYPLGRVLTSLSANCAVLDIDDTTLCSGPGGNKTLCDPNLPAALETLANNGCAITYYTSRGQSLDLCKTLNELNIQPKLLPGVDGCSMEGQVPVTQGGVTFLNRLDKGNYILHHLAVVLPISEATIIRSLIDDSTKPMTEEEKSTLANIVIVYADDCREVLDSVYKKLSSFGILCHRVYALPTIQTANQAWNGYLRSLDPDEKDDRQRAAGDVNNCKGYFEDFEAMLLDVVFATEEAKKIVQTYLQKAREENPDALTDDFVKLYRELQAHKKNDDLFSFRQTESAIRVFEALWNEFGWAKEPGGMRQYFATYCEYLSYVLGEVERNIDGTINEQAILDAMKVRIIGNPFFIPESKSQFINSARGQAFFAIKQKENATYTMDDYIDQLRGGLTPPTS